MVIRWLFSVLLLIISSQVSAQITEGDIYLGTEVMKSNKVAVLKMINRLATEHEACKAGISLSSMGNSVSKSLPGNPMFFVLCGRETPYQVVYFSLEDINKGVLPAMKKPIGEYSAGQVCREEIKKRVSNPASIDAASVFSDNYSASANGNASTALRFSAMNDFGVKKLFKIFCSFEGEKLAFVSVKPI